MDLKDAFQKLPKKSIKWDTYFPVYERVLAPFANRQITFVEVGVLNGGSLFLWKKYFGPNARIIGVDYNPASRILQDDGFEIFVGDQSSPQFWDDFYKKVGPIDILVDDGGHSNKQQIVTVNSALENMNEQGLIIVEDTHTSYLTDFGNPSKWSFVNFTKSIVDLINGRSPAVNNGVLDRWASTVHSVEFFESIVCLKINRKLCTRPVLLESGGKDLGAQDFREIDKQMVKGLAQKASGLIKSQAFKTVVKPVYQFLNRWYKRLMYWIENQKLSRYF